MISTVYWPRNGHVLCCNSCQTREMSQPEGVKPAGISS
jgi:hypothetical protein